MARSTNIVRSGSLNIAVQLMFLIAMYLAGSNTSLSITGGSRDVVILLFALLPCAIWTMFFYLQDRAEPEPATYVLVAFFVGMALASLLFNPIANRLFVVEEWIHQSLWTLFLGSLFVTGALSAFLFYLAIRYGFYLAKEFDEPADGMAYGAFVGSGFALVESVIYLLRHTDFTMFAMAYTSSCNALVYASIASIVGYFVGKSKFQRGSNEKNSIIGVLLGVLLFGAYTMANEYVLLNDIGDVLWISFLLTLIFSVGILLTVYLEMRKLTAKGFSQQVQLPGPADRLVFPLIVLLLLAGTYTRHHYTADLSFKNEKYGIGFTYPRSLTRRALVNLSMATFQPIKSSALIFSGEDRSANGFSLSVEIKANSNSSDSSKISLAEYLGGVQPISMYIDDVVVGAVKGTRLKYSFQQEGAFGIEEFPRILWAYTDIVPTGRRTVVLTFKADPAGFEKHKSTYNRILNSLQITD
jgi:protease PrsW